MHAPEARQPGQPGLSTPIEAADEPATTDRKTQLSLLIGLVALGGAVATAVVAMMAKDQTQGPVATSFAGAWLPLLLLGVTVVSDLIMVPLRHGGENEGLTLFEAAVVADDL